MIAAARPNSTSGPRRAAGNRVLLVDDEPALLSALRRIVQRARPDAVVVCAADAATAMGQLKTTVIRLVITDLKLESDPRAGLSVVTAAREAGIPIVVLTGGALPADLELLARLAVPVVAKGTLLAQQIAELIRDAFSPGEPT